MRTIAQCAKDWGCSISTVKRLYYQGRIDGAEKVGRDILIPDGVDRPALAEYGTLTPEQRAKWPAGKSAVQRVLQRNGKNGKRRRG